MPAHVRPTASFPTARIASRSGGLPVDVTLVAQLGHGAGDRVHRDACARQRGHDSYVDALDEPSATLAAADFGKGEASALFSFVVGAQGHPFHRHAGHRVFTAVSGSGGAQLRFSTASLQQLQASPQAFVDALHYVDIPPDCLFTVRFGGGTWHQFVPLKPDSRHPALFALSCHTNELGGIDDPALAAVVANGRADIPGLTELLPQAVTDHLRARAVDHASVPTLALSLDAPPGSLHGALCAIVRSAAGGIRSMAGAWRHGAGFIRGPRRDVHELPQPPADSLLHTELADRFEHQDSFRLIVRGPNLRNRPASALLADVLEGFLRNRPAGVSWLMQLRNLLVKPLRLRTSPLGCPASSLLSRERCNLFAGKYPVLGQSADASGSHAQVLLGADDRHLRFRSCVGVRIIGDETHVTLGTRVQCRNWFGRFYMASIGRVHRAYVSPAMLAMAAEHALREAHPTEASTALAF